MQIVALNSSPRDNQTSKTELLLQKFLEGARQAGASTETLYLRNYRIKHCLGCFSCWLKTPGRCVQADDMSEVLLDQYLVADLVVLATPIYFGNMNARLKAFIERTLPIYDPTRIESGLEEHMPLRFGRHPKIVALSVCGFPVPELFQFLSLAMQAIYKPFLVAEIYRHSSEYLDIPQFQPTVEKILAAAAQAGAEVVAQGRVGEATLAAIAQELAPAETLLQLSQQYWQEKLSKIEPGQA